jgi:polysaccharide biosynthesis/export protein
MKTRFLIAITHEMPGAEFRSAAGESRRAFRVPETAGTAACARAPQTRRSAPPAERLQHESSCWWRFASAWRRKPIDNSIPPSERKKFFRCLTSGLASAMILFAAGCKTDDFVSQTPRPSNYSELSKPASTANYQTLKVTNTFDRALLRAPTNLFTLGPGDKLDIELVDDTNSLSSTVVGPDGKIYFNLLPGIDVWGLTLGQTREVIQHDLTKYVRGEPQVNVTLRDVQSKHVWLLGRFQQPGIYNMAAPTTLLEAIAAAGGSQSFAGQRQISEGGPIGEDLADFNHSFVVRGNKMVPVDFHNLLEKGDLSQNIYLQPDDFIYFAPSYAKEVYVLGAVVQPKPVQYVRGMTLIQAITASYGTIRDAWLDHVTLVRGSLSQPDVTFVNYYDIAKGKTPDVPLQPGDIIYVPLTRYRYLRKYLDVALDTFVSSVAINAGTKISTPRSSGGSGITIPVGSTIIINGQPTQVPPIH